MQLQSRDEQSNLHDNSLLTDTSDGNKRLGRTPISIGALTFKWSSSRASEFPSSNCPELRLITFDGHVPYISMCSSHLMKMHNQRKFAELTGYIVYNSGPKRAHLLPVIIPQPNIMLDLPISYLILHTPVGYQVHDVSPDQRVELDPGRDPAPTNGSGRKSPKIENLATNPPQHPPPPPLPSATGFLVERIRKTNLLVIDYYKIVFLIANVIINVCTIETKFQEEGAGIQVITKIEVHSPITGPPKVQLAARTTMNHHSQVVVEYTDGVNRRWGLRGQGNTWNHA
ncbi:hypothetical protein LguiB_015497 [Lonicera macranthoides]